MLVCVCVCVCERSPNVPLTDHEACWPRSGDRRWRCGSPGGVSPSPESVLALHTHHTASGGDGSEPHAGQRQRPRWAVCWVREGERGVSEGREGGGGGGGRERGGSEG